ncbi:hypothetical protein [Actinoallomurus acaciae]|uniref:ESX-1 secretion-associated protein EspA/EspE-like domain-containing protein n=1 Tax=Actinoallomurus acaciae TaxID=502577 RepID=A0ABV5Y999_9ACTN
MGLTPPEALKDVLNLIGVPYPDVDTDGMHQSSAVHAQAQAAADTTATQAHDVVERTIGPGAPAYTGDAAGAMGGNSAQTDQMLTEANDAIGYIPGLISGAAKVVTSSQVAMISIAAVTAVALVRSSLIGGPFGPAESAAELLESRARAEGVLTAADEGTNITLSRLIERYVTGTLRQLVERLRLPPGEEPLPATGPGGTFQASDTRLAADSGSRRLTTDSLEANKGDTLNAWGEREGRRSDAEVDWSSLADIQEYRAEQTAVAAEEHLAEAERFGDPFEIRFAKARKELAEKDLQTLQERRRGRG